MFKNLDLTKLTFEEYNINPTFGTTTVYFVGPKELLGDKYSEAEHATVLLEFNTNNPYGAYPEIMISPTKEGYDYDWSYVYIENLSKINNFINTGLSYINKNINEMENKNG